MTTHSSSLAWKIPWTEEPSGLHSTGLQRVGHDWEADTCTLFFESRCLRPQPLGTGKLGSESQFQCSSLTPIFITNKDLEILD